MCCEIHKENAWIIDEIEIRLYKVEGLTIIVDCFTTLWGDEILAAMSSGLGDEDPGNRLVKVRILPSQQQKCWSKSASKV